MLWTHSPGFHSRYVYIVKQSDNIAQSVYYLECFSPSVPHELSVFVRSHAGKAEWAWMSLFSAAPRCFKLSCHSERQCFKLFQSSRGMGTFGKLQLNGTSVYSLFWLQTINYLPSNKNRNSLLVWVQVKLEWFTEYIQGINKILTANQYQETMWM